MSPDKIDFFLNWLDEEENKKGWTDYRLAKEAGINPSVISNARSGKLPGWEASLAIAKALRVDPVLVFRKVGLLPQERKIDDGLYKIKETYHTISDDEKQQLIEYADFIYEQSKKKKRKR